MHRLTGVILTLMIFFLVTAVPSASAGQVVSIKGKELRALVKKYIETNMPWKEDDLRIEFLSRITDPPVQGEKISCQVKSRQDEHYIGDSVFTVGIYDDGTLIREESVRVRMEVAMDVVMSAKFLPRDTEINADDVKVVRRWFNQNPANIVTQVEDVVGKHPYSDIRQNVEIKRNMLKSAKTIKRGKMVKMVLESGPMVIITFGLSEEDGSRGDFIKVKNISSNKIVYAKIIDDSSVRVDF
ncbi:MAG: flagellar basal body P-ring formation chaperone FlgA [Syntrophales bacterium]